MDLPEDELRTHVRALSLDIGERSASSRGGLEAGAEYIKGALAGLGYEVREQSYRAGGAVYRNLIAEKKGRERPGEIVLAGAHYDTVEHTPGADDNASGVAGLLELARLLREVPLRRTLRLVAFTLEEPPFFRSEHMGSRVYVKAVRRRGDDVRAMLCLESIGYYTALPDSQDYPLPLMGLFYPDRGDFVAVVGNFASRGLVERVARGIKEGASLPVETLVSPALVTGVDFSDHASFWEQGYRAVMITDTAMFRNPNYHLPTDTAATLDYGAMAELVKGLVRTIKILDRTEGL